MVGGVDKLDWWERIVVVKIDSDRPGAAPGEQVDTVGPPTLKMGHEGLVCDRLFDLPAAAGGGITGAINVGKTGEKFPENPDLF